MLYLIKSMSDKFADCINHDPVRPHIPHIERIGDNKDIFVLRDEQEAAQAVTCVSYQNSIPTSELELFGTAITDPDTAVFYTIWSYKAGAGRSLIFEAVKYIKENKPTITKFVTLSPKTEMAKRFHTKNGAIVFRENVESTNYEYLDR